jgi:hypothetical protein
MFLLDTITDAGRVLLTLIGLSSPYPDVTISDSVLRINREGACIEFRAAPLVNKQLRELADSGYTLNILADYTVRSGNAEPVNRKSERSVYRAASGWIISDEQTNRIYPDFNSMTNAVSRFVLPVLPVSETQPGKEVDVTAELGVSCAEIPNVIELWGNRPRLHQSFRL